MTSTDLNDRARGEAAAPHPEDVRPTGPLAWLARCVAAEVTAREVANIRRWGAWMIAWFVVAVPNAEWFGAVDGRTSAVTVTQGVLVLVALSGLVWSYARYVMETDELNRSIQLRALAIGFAAGFLTTEIGQAAINAGFVESVDVDVTALSLLMTYAISSVVIQARYR